MLSPIDGSNDPRLLHAVSIAVIFVMSLVLLERSADIFVDSTAIVAKRLGIPTVLIGLLTAGAEWEELAVVVSSLSKNNPDLALSNIIGSCIANILGSFSLGLIFARNNSLSLSPEDTFSAKLYSTLLVPLVILVLALGPVSFGLYVAGIMYGIKQGNVVPPEDSDSDSDTSDEEDEGNVTDRTPLIDTERPHQTKSTNRHIVFLVLSAAALSLAGILLASTTSTLADLLHISQPTAGLTILSIATTLPEKLVAYKAGREAQAGVLTANTVGSNVFLLTLVLGVVWVSLGELSLTSPVVDEVNRIWLDLLIVLASSAVLWVVVWTNKFKKGVGVAMILAYTSYIVWVVLR